MRYTYALSQGVQVRAWLSEISAIPPPPSDRRLLVITQKLVMVLCGEVCLPVVMFFSSKLILATSCQGPGGSYSLTTTNPQAFSSCRLFLRV